MVIGDNNADQLVSYDLSTDWDPDTASYNGDSQYIGYIAAQPQSPRFNSDGTKLFIADRTNNVSEVQLSTAWDITTVSPLDIVETIRDNIAPRGIALRGDEAKLFVLRDSAPEIAQYDLAYSGDALASVQQP